MAIPPNKPGLWDPIEASREIGRRYLRYLATSFYFRDPGLRMSFRRALESERLLNGPFLEATPVYRRGRTSRELVPELLGREPDPGFVTALQPDRRLYAHQEGAIRKLMDGQNVVVATGTGSGKTEAYLWPVLLHLYKEFLGGDRRAGVRALVLYPMNALANDQRRRLGKYCETLAKNGSPFSFTFGRYTGETPEDEGAKKRNASDQIEARLRSELVFRRQMRERPPDILLTNYSMLEYLLLRPDDSSLFDDGHGATWRFLILDEAHQYRGAKGIEVAMLIRRLKQRLREGGHEGRLRCIATSASLGGGDPDREPLAEFASKLFDEPFSSDDVVLEEPVPVPDVDRPTGPITGPATIDLARLAAAGDEEGAAKLCLDIARQQGVKPAPAAALDALLHMAFSADSRATELRKLLGRPRRVEELADQLYGELSGDERTGALAALVQLLMRGRDPGTDAPLLSARYHLFIRGLEGAFVRYRPDKCVSLARGVSDEKHKAAAFEVALCQECGQHYFVGRRHDGRLVEPVRDPGLEEYKVEFYRPIDEFEEGAEDAEKSRARLCLRCGALSRARRQGRPDHPDCEHGDSIIVVEEEARTGREDQIRTCGVCGHRGRDPVREIVHGTDGPNAVIVTTLHSLLPEERRKVLAFADGRQEAAFFAWYAQQTHEGVRNRGVLLKALRGLARAGHHVVAPETLAVEVRHLLQEAGVLGEATTDIEALQRAWIVVLGELLTDEPRLSLEGVALVRWTPELPPDLEVPGSLLERPWSMTEDAARDTARYLIDTLRTDRSMELPSAPGLRLQWDDLGLRAQQTRTEIGGQGQIKAWDGPRTRRVLLLSRLLEEQSNGELPHSARIEKAQAVLRELWKALLRAGGGEKLLLRAGDGKRANPRWWRAQLLPEDATLWRCNVCGRYQTPSVKRLCTRYGCPGHLDRLDGVDEELRSNHYRLLYQEPLPARFRAEEHTAQIERETAREFQEDFESGRIHLLSCSTTFELGVDLGDLDTILLRNVPPEPFNYAQRVGRAGRRPGRPGFAVTYCRRRPHDLDYFNRVEDLLSGQTRPPSLSLQNEKIAHRHACAIVLSHFFRRNQERFGNVAAFFIDLRNPRATGDLEAFIARHREALEGQLRAVLPTRLLAALGLEDGGWPSRLCGDGSPLEKAQAEVSDDYRKVIAFEEQARNERRYGDADWARRRADTIAGQDVISFLSRKAVIPKYGFPVDVVELDLQQARGAPQFGVTLERDLAIAVAEFAPEAKVVANKKLWTSHGLKRVAGKAWERSRYRKCRRHGSFEIWGWSDEPPGQACCNEARPLVCIDPIFGFSVRRGTPDEPSGRPERLFTTRPYFSRLTSGILGTIEMGGVARLTKASPGYLVVLCEGKRGKGFLICEECGAGFTGQPRDREHRTALGGSCRGPLQPAALGHQFLTDVVLVDFLPEAVVTNADVDGLWFPHSLAYALVLGAASTLEVPLQDLNVTVTSAGASAHSSPRIVLYDNVPGGAGLVARLEDPPRFRQCLDAARDRVSGRCGCGPEASCYGCLRHYGNQFAHPYLARGPVQDYLESLLREW